MAVAAQALVYGGHSGVPERPMEKNYRQMDE